jgi:magnesium-transporting ATPase (P-type)
MWAFVNNLNCQSIMKQKMKAVDWLDEECDSLARKGLRTLVFACKDLTEDVRFFYLNHV